MRIMSQDFQLMRTYRIKSIVGFDMFEKKVSQLDYLLAKNVFPRLKETHGTVNVVVYNDHIVPLLKQGPGNIVLNIETRSALLAGIYASPVGVDEYTYSSSTSLVTMKLNYVDIEDAYNYGDLEGQEATALLDYVTDFLHTQKVYTVKAKKIIKAMYEVTDVIQGAAMVNNPFFYCAINLHHVGNKPICTKMHTEVRKLGGKWESYPKEITEMNRLMEKYYRLLTHYHDEIKKFTLLS